MKTHKGFAFLPAILIIVALIAAGGGLYVYNNQDLLEDADGGKVTNVTKKSDEGQNWKIYSSAKYGFEFAYPAGHTVSDYQSQDLHPNDPLIVQMARVTADGINKEWIAVYGHPAGSKLIEAEGRRVMKGKDIVIELNGDPKLLDQVVQTFKFTGDASAALTPAKDDGQGNYPWDTFARSNPKFVFTYSHEWLTDSTDDEPMMLVTFIDNEDVPHKENRTEYIPELVVHYAPSFPLFLEFLHSIDFEYRNVFTYTLADLIDNRRLPGFVLSEKIIVDDNTTAYIGTSSRYPGQEIVLMQNVGVYALFFEKNADARNHILQSWRFSW